MKQYCVYTRDFAHVKGMFAQLDHMSIQLDMHINRTRFWLDPANTEHYTLYLKYSQYIHCVDHESDHSLGV